MTDNDDDYEVGYGKPPTANRFKPGQSGNPAGRKAKPKPRSGIKPALKEALEEAITINGKKYTPMEVVVRSLTNKAMKGDRASIKMLIDLQEKHIPEKLTKHGGALVVTRTPDYLREINAYLQQTEARGGEPKDVYTWGDVPEDMLARAAKLLDKERQV